MVSQVGEKLGQVVHVAFRMVVGFLFACHGAATLFGVPTGVAGAVARFAEWPSWWAALIELVGGLLVALGLGTRVAALICSGTMAYAYFVVHQRGGPLPIQNGGEPAALYSWLFLLIATIGPGALALDRLIPTPGQARRVPSSGSFRRS